MNTANLPPAQVRDRPFDSLLQKTLRCSRYARRALEIDPPLLSWLQENCATPCDRAEMLELLRQANLAPDDEAGLARALRRLRKQVMVKLILRDLNGLCGLGEVMQAMTALAEISVGQAQACLMQVLRAQFGTPLGETDAAPQPLLVIGMGKLGGGELNVSSDIDLIFVYPEDGETDGPRRLSNHEFFTRLGRRLIAMIGDPTGDGYVFRVDMRLRPYGDSGPLVASFAALEEYLVSQGREWERYAWIKARVISPADCPQTTELMQLAQPFVFRKYLDFGAIDSMRKLHAQIRQEVRRRDLLDNIKLGPGGIREIEFTAQVFQLIRGGRDAQLRIRPTQSALQQLATNGQLPAPAAADLDAAYVFLRNLEHRLQYLDDQQTQELPEKTEDREIIADAMGYADYAALLNDLDRHRMLVNQQFEQIFGAHEEGPDDGQLWHEGMTAEELQPRLEKLGYRAANDTAQRLLQLHDGSRYRQLPELSRQRLDKLIPQFAALSAQQPNPDETLARLLVLLEGISRRAAYLAFLAEYPQAMQRLAKLLSASSWAGDYMTQHPALLDGLLGAREIYQPPQWQQLDRDLHRRLDDCAGDAERQLDMLRLVQQEQTFQLLAMDLQGLLPLEKLSDHLSDLADLLLRHVLRLSWAAARKRHCDEPKFAVIAYGKLGGKELSYASDLDLIFLYDDDHPDAQENYARLGQRINTMLSSYTSSGRLYETDLRLRPNGASGLLVSTVGAFAEYQRQSAWVWEHQALTRARFSAGDAGVGAAFENIRKEVLCQPRDLPALRTEILAMRQKMLDGHPNASGLFDLKHDRGGMVDIEFMVQYIVLAYAHQHPQLTGNIGNLALLKLAGELGLIPVALAEQTRALYRALRQAQHRMQLNNQSPCRAEPGQIEVGACRKLWEALFEKA
ncbi:MAG: bifunctional glutamine synthetase adenylyltransferase/deadenyltransferase [Gallionellales bacterium RIFCSPLOWO2_12_FULL_59_22]|nr:MAG: bifunctional glutamine synthetase adenylyltransferase/deadenyltransferase [Gallionellales bacterium RIFCSPLOWO2_02_FULL_59_110]OGT02651.1 MAG: bifunctional glutamine synthetase adenylyltransferase/deadenyltransferase [Gallionellales bacterium RIFCSPLOWO2_02_58_13]OGT10707.1 MAG: bifunctional glutamine synthetase adenylyltransferase/deadenyltransferase [Gallionellales bacterium RIFCSPLOWO2_12_FULL_59_22]